MRLIEPVTTQDFEKYYQLRWEVLRAPWNQPKGSEKDDAENSSIHVMALNENEECVGVSRLQKNSEEEYQVRFMGVRKDQQGKGIGKLLMDYLEEKAKKTGAKKIILQSREIAVPFYLSIGYEVKEKTFKLWGIIQHYRMEKVVGA
jgi:predicted GNAT family N-acyltransferase